MRKRTQLLFAVALMSTSIGALAAESSGHWFNHTTSTTQTKLPDGRTSAVFHYYQSFVTDDANDPMNNTAGDCTGNMMLSKEGKTLSGSGICFADDGNGDGISLWWKVDEAGIAKCPDICGSFASVDGHGKFKGATNSGTWERTHRFGEDGSSGTFKATYTMK
jgi:hypothetical protein